MKVLLKYCNSHTHILLTSKQCGKYHECSIRAHQAFNSTHCFLLIECSIREYPFTFTPVYYADINAHLVYLYVTELAILIQA